MFEGWAQTLPLQNIRQLDSRQSISAASTQRTGNTFTERAPGQPGDTERCRKEINGCKLEIGMAAIDPCSGGGKRMGLVSSQCHGTLTRDWHRHTHCVDSAVWLRLRWVDVLPLLWNKTSIRSWLMQGIPIIFQLYMSSLRCWNADINLFKKSAADF